MNAFGLSDEQLTKVKVLVSNGQKLYAVKYIKDITSAGLKDVKNFVDSLSDKLGNLPLSHPYKEENTAQITVDQNMVRSFLNQGKKLEAIKYVKDTTGIGLKEALKYVDQLESENFSKSTNINFDLGHHPPRRISIKLLLLITAIIFILYWLMRA